jgi:hypothetical protein
MTCRKHRANDGLRRVIKELDGRLVRPAEQRAGDRRAKARRDNDRRAQFAGHNPLMRRFLGQQFSCERLIVAQALDNRL